MRSAVKTKRCTEPMEEMEKLLHIWIDDQIQKRIPVGIYAVQKKARSKELNIEVKTSTYDIP